MSLFSELLRLVMPEPKRMERPGVTPENQKALVDAACESSGRSRRVLIALQMFSFLVAVMVVNTFHGTWLERRLEVAKSARVLAECIYQGVPREFEPSRLPVFPGHFRLLSNAPEFDKAVGDLIGLCPRSPKLMSMAAGKRDLEFAAGFLAYGAHSRNGLDAYIAAAEKARAENALEIPIPIPAVSLRIDTNFLGAFSGLGFLLLYCWLWLSAKRELRNLERLVEVGASEVGGLYVVAADQIFTPTGGNARWLVSLISGLATFAPVMVLALIAGNDFLTFRVGMIFSPGLTWIISSLEWVLLVINLVAAILCTSEQSRIAAFWSEHMPDVSLPIWEGHSKFVLGPTRDDLPRRGEDER